MIQLIVMEIFEDPMFSDHKSMMNDVVTDMYRASKRQKGYVDGVISSILFLRQICFSLNN